MNNFKELEKMELAQAEFKDQYVRSGISSTMGAFRFFGDMLEHFIPRVLGMFINMAGGESQESVRRPKYPNRPN